MTYLRKLSTTEILNASVPLISVTDGRTSLRHFAIDGYALPRSPAEIFGAGQQHPIPLLIGTNARERSPGLVQLPDDLSATLRSAYGPLAERAIALYRNSDALYGTPAEQWASDTSWRCDAVLQASWHAKAGHPTYHYEFSRSAPGRKAVGAMHTAEMWYVFGTLGLGRAPAGPLPQYDTMDHAISEAVQDYWTNFAKTGDPNGGSLPRWRRFEEPDRAYIDFSDAGPIMREALRKRFCDLHIENSQRLAGG